MEQVVIGCLVTYLESSGIQNLLVKVEVYDPAVVNPVELWRLYLSKRGMSLTAKAMEQLQVYSFLKSSDGLLLHYLIKSTNLLL